MKTLTAEEVMPLVRILAPLIARSDEQQKADFVAVFNVCIKVVSKCNTVGGAVLALQDARDKGASTLVPLAEPDFQGLAATFATGLNKTMASQPELAAWITVGAIAVMENEAAAHHLGSRHDHARCDPDCCRVLCDGDDCVHKGGPGPQIPCPMKTTLGG